MKKLNILILTNHNKHSKEDTTYSLIQQMGKDESLKKLYIMSKGHNKNNDFFVKKGVKEIYAKELDEKFIFSKNSLWFNSGFKNIKINSIDILIIRIDRPISNDELLNIRYLFGIKLIINSPEGIIKTRSKEFLPTSFSKICPTMNICRNIYDVKNELIKYDIILKPLDEGKGEGLIKINNNKIDINDKVYSYSEGMPLLEKELKKQKKMLSMKYLKRVINGDKRILVVNGKILGGVLRLPKKNSWKCNINQGGSTHPSEVNPEEIDIANTLSPELEKLGIIIYGFDTLEDDNGKRCLSEINTLNVGGFLQLQDYSKEPIIKYLSDNIWAYINNKQKEATPM